MLVINVKVTLVDGQAHDADSTEGAFEAARRRGLNIMLSTGVETDPEGFDEIEDSTF